MDGGGVLWSSGALRKVVDASNSGDPQAQYLIGLAGTLDPSLRIATEKARQLLLSAAQGGQPQAQYWVGRRFAEMARCGQEGKESLWLQQAATSGDGPAQVTLATNLLSAGASADHIAQAKALLAQAAQSDSFYVRKHVVALMASSPIEGIRDPVTALAVARKLANGEIQVDPQMFEAVAVAYAINANFSSAVSNQETAIKKAKTLYWNTSLMEERLKSYQASQAWTGELFTLPPASDKPPPLKETAKPCISGAPHCKERTQPDAPKAPMGSRLPQ
jgi:TPR repeat protein